MFGFLNINKPKGLTSHDIVSRLRKITNIKQIGHTGTLDPFATGVLPVCIGKATKLIEYMQDDKEYLATVQFGKNTDSYDIDGIVTEEFKRKINQIELEQALVNFRGEITQYPPIYSAIKVNGKKLYEYARKGEEVEIQPRKVTISKLKLVDFNEEEQSAKLLIACSKGTYIRSIAFDIGKTLCCGAYLSALERTKAGYFAIEDCVSLEDLTNLEKVSKNLYNPLELMSEYSQYNLTDDEEEKVSHGNSIKNRNSNVTNIVFLVYRGKMYAIGETTGYSIKIKKVFGK